MLLFNGVTQIKCEDCKNLYVEQQIVQPQLLDKNVIESYVAFT